MLKEIIRVTKAKKSGGGWIGHCPAHDDQNPSLSFREADGGQILVKCHTGCAQKNVIVRLKELNAWPTPNRQQPSKGAGVSLKEYFYHDANGEACLKKVRAEKPGQRKKFTLFHRDGDAWKPGASSCEIVPYRYGDWRDDKGPLFLVEGEKVVDTLLDQGLSATTTGGATSWRSSFAKYFVGRKVIVIPDNDEPGRRYAQSAAEDLLVTAESVAIVEIEGLPPGGDAVDFFEGGGTVDHLMALAESARPYQLQRDPLAPTLEHGFSIYTLDQILKMKTPEKPWVLEGIIPTGGVSIIVGPPKSGKTTLLRSLCVAVARGERFLERATKQGPVIVFGLEEHASHLKDYFQKMGVQPEEPIFFVLGDLPEEERLKCLHLLLKDRSPALVVIDTLFKFKGVKDTNDYAETTSLLAEFLSVARDFDGAIILVHHQRKDSLSTSSSILGSQAIFGGVDTAIYLQVKDGERSIQTAQRFGESLEETIITFDKATKAFTLGPAKKQKVTGELGTRVLSGLRSGPKTFSDLLKKVGGNKEFLRGVLEELIGRNEITQSGEGKRNSPFIYAIPDSPPSLIEEAGVRNGNDPQFDFRANVEWSPETQESSSGGDR